MNYANRWVVPLIMASISAFGLNSTATAQDIAPAAAAGECRAVKHSTPIFSERSAPSPALRLLGTNDRVTLAEGSGTNGFIAVSSPTRGYVLAENLKPCSSGPVGSRCRRVAYAGGADGLIIRSQPDPDSVNRGAVALGSRVLLSTDPATVRTGPEGRRWIQIAEPTAGWVSNGFPGSPSNLSNCP
jgi:hypothetical protein